MRVIEVPFQILKNEWIWYPSRKAVFWLKDELVEALNKYNLSTSDEELLTSNYSKKYLTKGGMPHLKRLRDAIALWDSIKRHGFNKDKSVFKMNMTNEGRLRVIDGFHRLIILDYMDYKGNIIIEIQEEDNGWLEFKQKLGQLRPIYSPILHPCLVNLSYYRHDSQRRLDYIRSEMPSVVNNVIDMGSCEGFFSFGVYDKAKGHIFGIERNKLRWEVSRYLNRLYNRESSKITFYNHDFIDFLDSTKHHFNVGIFLSTFHHLLIPQGKKVWETLNSLSEKVDTLFFSMAIKGDKVWKNHSSLPADIETVPEFVKEYWGYEQFKIASIQTDNNRTIFKFWRG